MIPISSEWMTATATILMLVSVRIFGFFLVMPLFAFRAMPLRMRLVLALAVTLMLAPSVQTRYPAEAMAQMAPGYVLVGLELAIGAAAGFMVRLGFMVIDLLAEVLSAQAGLSFASTFSQDPALVSGLTGEFLGMVALALAFVMNLHIALLGMLLGSFQALPFGVWPGAWSLEAVVGLFREAFSLGLVLSLVPIVVYMMFNLTQAVLVRVSPQLNLFAIGFPIMVPVAFVVIAMLLPSMPDIVQRAMEAPARVIKLGLEKPAATPTTPSAPATK